MRSNHLAIFSTRNHTPLRNMFTWHAWLQIKTDAMLCLPAKSNSPCSLSGFSPASHTRPPGTYASTSVQFDAIIQFLWLDPSFVQPSLSLACYLMRFI